MNSDTPKQDCPSADVLAALIDGTPVEGNEVSIEQHIGECANCQAALESLGGSARWVELRGFLTESDTIEFGAQHARYSTVTSSFLVDSSLPDIDGFEVLSEIGRGGMGVVYRARDKALNRIVAIKMLIGGALSGPDRLARFQNEAESIARLEHTLIVQIYSVGRYNGQPFLVLEHVDGTNLKELCRHRKLTQREAAQCLVRIGDALQFAHDNGVVHRDLKPENILISAGVDLIPKITDFGLARQFDIESDTVSETVLGTPAYMPPEAFNRNDDAVPVVSDVYGLGTLLYFVLFGVPPFQESTAMETLSAVTNSPVRIPDEPKVAMDLQVILLKCLEKRPEDRYQSARELTNELVRFLEHVPINARPVSTFGRIRRWCYARPAVASLLAMLAVVVSFSVAAIGIQTARVARARRVSADFELQTRAMQNVVDLGVYVRTFADTNDAWSTRDHERMQTYLEKCPANFRSWEWNFLKTVGRPVESHRLNSSISAMRTTLAGDYLAIGTVDGDVNISRITAPGDNARVIPQLLSRHDLRPADQTVQSLCFNNDGTRLIVGYVDQFAVVEFQDDRPTVRQLISQPGLTGVGFDSTGECILTCSNTGRIARYASKSGVLISEVLTAGEHYVGISCTGTLRLATRDWGLFECDAESLQVMSKTKIQMTIDTTAVVTNAYFSVDGREVAIHDSNNSVRVVVARTGKRLSTLAGHSDTILNARYSRHHGLLATCDSGGTARLWTLGENATLDAAPRVVCSGSVGAVEWLRGGAYVALGRDNGSVNVYPANDELTQTLFDNATHTTHSLQNDVHRAVSAFHPQREMVATSGHDGRVCLRDTNSLGLIREYDKHPDRVRGISFSGNGQRILTACNDGKLREFNTDSGEMVFEYQLYKEGNCSALACSPDGRIAVFGGGHDNYAIVWDVERRSVIRTVRDFFERTIRDICFNRDGSRFAVAGGPEVHVFETHAGTELLRLKGHSGRAYRCEFSQDDRWIVTNANDGTARIWDAKSGQRMAMFRNMDSLGFTPDSRRVLLQPVTGKESEIRFVDVASGFVVWTCRLGSLGIENVLFSPDGNSLFAVCRDKKVRIWSVDPSDSL